MIRLYEHPISPYARKVKLALREKGLEFERHVVPPGELDGDELGKANPRHEVPALVDGTVEIFDSTIICEYLEDRYPTPPLYPTDPAERARARMLEDLADTQYEPLPWALMEIRFFDRASGDLADHLTARAKEGLERMLDRLERELGHAPFLTGGFFGVADCAFLPHVGGAAVNGVKAGPGRPRLAEWVARALERPSAKADRADARASLENADRDGKAAKARPRQYRDHRLDWMMRNGGAKIVEEGIANGTIQFSRDV